MLNKLKPKSEFSKNVLTLMTGTTIAQAIPIAISPILTRIYTPADFGIFSLYMSTAAIFSVLATGRYEAAIILPKTNKEASYIVILSLLISLIVSVFILIFIILFDEQIAILLDNKNILHWLYFIPVTVFLTGIYQSLNYWVNRKKYYKKLALSRVSQSIVTSGSSVGMGFSGLSIAGLIYSNILGQIASIIVLFKSIYLKDLKYLNFFNKNRILFVVRKYSKFPKFDLLASLSNVSAQYLVNILFTALFTTTVAGYYYLTQKMLSIPVTLIAASILDVFKEQASKDYKKFGNARKIYIQTFKKLLILSFIPSIIVYFFSVDIFTYIFGEAWEVSGEYARILVPMLFFRFISSPLSFMLYIGEKQELNLVGNLLFLLGTIGSLYFASSPMDAVVHLSFSFSFIYIMYLLFSAKIAKVW